MRPPPSQRTAPRQATVSVVIPVKDDSAELAVCLSGLSSQSRPPDEIIVVDNAPSDASASTAEAGGAMVVSCPEPGIPAASSRGYDSATGDLILRLDADCRPPATWIDSVVTAFDQYPGVAALTGSARFIDGPVLLRTPLAAIYQLAYTAAATPALGHRPLFGSNLAMRGDTWRTVRDLVHRDDPELHDDFDLSFHIGERHRVRHLRGEPMGISMRPFHSVGSLRRRMYRGFHTVTAHWPHDFPPHRWRRMLQYRKFSSLPRARSYR